MCRCEPVQQSTAKGVRGLVELTHLEAPLSLFFHFLVQSGQSRSCRRMAVLPNQSGTGNGSLGGDGARRTSFFSFVFGGAEGVRDALALAMAIDVSALARKVNLSASLAAVSPRKTGSSSESSFTSIAWSLPFPLPPALLSELFDAARTAPRTPFAIALMLLDVDATGGSMNSGSSEEEEEKVGLSGGMGPSAFVLTP